MAGILAKLFLSTVLGGTPLAGAINEVIKKPTDTIDVVLAWDADRSVACTHARVMLPEAVRDQFNLDNKPHLLHITNYDQTGEVYKAGEQLTIPLDVSGLELRTIGYTGKSFYAPEEYVTRH